MLKYTDYFSEEATGQPYLDNADFLSDLRLVLDALLEEYSRIRSNRRSSDYLTLPPAMRAQEHLQGNAEAFDEMLRHIDSRLAISEDTEIPLVELIRRFDLSEYKILSVVLALAPELDSRYSEIFAASGGAADGRPLLGEVNDICDFIEIEKPFGEEDDILSKDGIMGRIFFADDDGNTHPRPLTALRLYPDIVSYLKGEYSLYDFLKLCFDGLFLTPVTSDCYGFDYLRDISTGLKAYRKLVLTGTAKDFGAEGRTKETHRSALKDAIVYMLGDRLILNPVCVSVPVYLACSPSLCREYLHKILLLLSEGHTLLYFTGITADMLSNIALLSLIRQVGELFPDARMIFDVTLSDNEGRARAEQARLREKEFADAFVIGLKMPGMDERLSFWREMLKDVIKNEADDDGLKGEQDIPSGEKHANDDSNIDSVLENIAECYELEYDEILAISENIRKVVSRTSKKELTKEVILSEIDKECTAAFGSLAVRIPSDYTWSDLKLDSKQADILKLACGRYMHRSHMERDWKIGRRGAYGNGVSVLMYGPPGTGKTMAAQIVANEIGLPLYRVDLSQLSSKYIGETEKNLAKVFDEAARSNVILFFDEADSIFSKRTEIESAHDKYANNESAYLLQKLEEYSGFVLLATNLYINFDSAFVRRITYIVKFNSPDVETRKELWRMILPPEAKLAERIDYDFFAEKFEFSGSNIKSVLTDAAFMATIEGTGITNRHIVMSICYELNKLGKMVSVNAFGPYGCYCI